MSEKTDIKSLGVADSMAQAAGLTGYSEENLARAKSAGCPAFRGSRVYVDELVAWLEQNREVLLTGDSQLDAVNLQIAMQKLRKITFENEVNEARYIAKDQIAARFLHYGTDLALILQRSLEDDAPLRMAGKTTDELRPIMRSIRDEICDAIQAAARACAH